jgi:integrase
MAKLTKQLVDSAKAPEPGSGKPYIYYWDNEVKGFGLRVTASNIKTYIIRYRNQSRKQHIINLGRHGVLTAIKARELAKQKLADVACGSNPAEERHQSKTAPTVADLATDYINRHAIPRKRPKSVKSDQSQIDRLILPQIGTQKIKDITYRDIESLVLSKSKTPYAANRLRALLSIMFNKAIAWNWITINPVTHVRKFDEHKVERWLSEQELDRLLNVLAQHQNQRAANAVRLLILTGARRGEVLSATWDQFNFEDGVWIKESHQTKQKKFERTPLSSPAISLLQTMKSEQEKDEQFLFPGNSKDAPLTDIKKFWAGVRSEVGIEDVRIHDLRHTFGSHLASSGMSLLIIGKLLGHTQQSTTQRYAHLADEPVRTATNQFGEIFERANNPNGTKKPSNE